MLTHIDKNKLPTMVDITEKNISTRIAKATSRIQLGEEFRSLIDGEELHLKKGAVIQTAIIAGTMAVKKTHEVIPFCHQLPIESCKFKTKINDDLSIDIFCTVKTSFKTGVEMEALYGATAAALTVYDMCKAVSHNIQIKETKLVSKTGGKRTVLDKPVYGLVLTGGKSKRMNQDKALLDYKGVPHAKYIYNILDLYCEKTYLSTQEGQWTGSELESLSAIIDLELKGPMSGILSAFRKHPDAYWLIVACDLPHFNKVTVEKLIASLEDECMAVAYKNIEKGFAEPLCTLYTPKASLVFEQAMQEDIKCPVKVLRTTSETTILLEQSENINLANINTPEELREMQNEVN